MKIEKKITYSIFIQELNKMQKSKKLINRNIYILKYKKNKISNNYNIIIMSYSENIFNFFWRYFF